MSLVTVRDAIATYYTAQITTANVSKHEGAFGLEDIKRYALKPPAIVIACLGIPSFQIQGGGVMVAEASWGAFCITKEKKTEGKGDQAMLLATLVASKLISNDWGDATVSTSPSKISAPNLFSVALDKLGVALWAVRWDQGVELAAETLAAELDAFETLYSTVDVGQTDDTATTVIATELDQP